MYQHTTDTTSKKEKKEEGNRTIKTIPHLTMPNLTVQDRTLAYLNQIARRTNIIPNAIPDPAESPMVFLFLQHLLARIIIVPANPTTNVAAILSNIQSSECELGETNNPYLALPYLTLYTLIQPLSVVDGVLAA
ncbi:MAG: hypothetical protein WC325_11445 [Candidatus Bathyarchaeia archaeon]|jgi:hypothetical protein